MLLNISQISQENNCWSLFLIKLQTFRLEACNFLQKRLYGDLHGDSNTVIFLWNLQNLQEHLFVQNNSVYNVLYSVFCNFRNWMDTFLKLILGKVPVCNEYIYLIFKFQTDGSNSM